MVAHCHLCSTSNKRMMFMVVEACLIVGARKNAYHTKYRDMIYADNFSCESLRKGIFIAGAIFVVATMILNVYYYMYFTKATTQPAQKKHLSNSNSWHDGTCIDFAGRKFRFT